jgi:DNA-binding NtrC family response regulator
MNVIAKPIVAVVDDDPRIRESLESLIESAGMKARVFSLAEDFLQGDSARDELFDHRRPDAKDEWSGIATADPARAPGTACHFHYGSS